IVIHIEAPDEAGHAGSIEDKVEAIERVDREVVSQLVSWDKDALRILAMPDHHTPIEVRTHTPDPVPFLLWGPGFSISGALRLTEAEAKSTGVFIENGHTLIDNLIRV
ncbi:MAG: cofactor-independent phosphoglycerate mutase, partial [Dehalococcoidia bacterium]|nr:cofactor-independent phosphoglycerate mutase [Dehalococcoidia bacterium]